MTTVISSVDLVGPVVRQASGPGRLAVFDVQPKRNVPLAFGIGLDPNRISIHKGHRAGIIESADTLQRRERVVEGPVLLHQNHDVLGVEVSAPRRRLDSERPLDGCRERAKTPVAPARSTCSMNSRLVCMISPGHERPLDRTSWRAHARALCSAKPSIDPFVHGVRPFAGDAVPHERGQICVADQATRTWVSNFTQS